MSKNKLFFLFIHLFAGTFLFAQSDLVVQGNTPDLHLVHTVSPKETWYSIGRLYNISPKELAPYNQVELEKPLAIGQQIRVPLRPLNFSQDGRKETDEVFVPVYHIIQEREWLYRISLNHNKVPVESLERWNNIDKDQAKAGLPLIVGYLKVKSSSDLARLAVQIPPVLSTPPVSQPEAIVKKEEPEAKKEEVAKTTETIAKRDIETPVKKEESKLIIQEIKKEESVPPPVLKTGIPEPKAIPAGNFKEGYFRSQFEQNGREAFGVSGVFKSTSGWNDGKYYALMNGVAVGTIVKVNFPSTNKSIYAKVLGQLPDMRESSGLTIRISDAAASELGAGNNKFTVDVQY